MFTFEFPAQSVKRMMTLCYFVGSMPTTYEYIKKNVDIAFTRL